MRMGVEEDLKKEKRMKLSRIKSQLDSTTSAVKAGFSIVVDEATISDLDWLATELLDSWDKIEYLACKNKNLIDEDLKRLNAEADFEAGC